MYRVLAKHDRPAPVGTGPSWLSFIGHSTDSLWSADLFRCESIALRSDWVLVVMDQFTRRLIGFGMHCTAWLEQPDRIKPVERTIEYCPDLSIDLEPCAVAVIAIAARQENSALKPTTACRAPARRCRSPGRYR